MEISTGMLFIFIGIIVILIFEVNNHFSSKKFVNDAEPYFRFLMEDDYKFLLSVKYQGEINVEKLFSQRVRNGLIAVVFVFFLFLSKIFKISK